MTNDRFHDELAGAATLQQVLDERVRRQGGEVWLTLYAKDRVGCRLTYAELREGAGRWAALLAREGVGPGCAVLLILPTERAFYEAYWGILLAGGVPVPAYPPVRMGRLEEYLDGLARVASTAGVRHLVTNGLIRPLVRPVEDRIGEKVRLLTPADVPAGGDGPRLGVRPDDLALLQFTSGSTGAQKGVMLTHDNLLANLRAIAHGIRPGPGDVAVSWLPLYHDMGLIGLMLGSLYFGVPLVACSPIDFLRRPVRWLRMLSDHGGTLTAGPNFAYSLVARKVRDADLAGLDLSALRVALCGAEPIHPSTVEAFTRRFQAVGLRPEAFFPAYGLAENTLAVSFSDLGRPPRLQAVRADRLEAEGRAEPCPAGEGARVLVSVGRPLPTVEVAVVDETDRPVPEGVRGEIVVRGPSVMKGYYGNPEATAATLRGGWLHTGDLGFFLDGHLYVSGRKKDLVIKAGRNYFAEDLEAAAGRVEGVKPGGVCAFSVEREDRGTEEVVLVVETRDPHPREGLADEVRAAVASATGCRPDRVIVVPARTLPKTSSGKLQRFRTRSWYLDGTLTLRGGERRTTGLGAYLLAWGRDVVQRFRR
ncbi:MAG: fatty acyl-AMP ligase [Deltaproteobacteria bacterium]|nr:fatty acyl-AMP ligase [Deltaproteobacteria bacterium]